MALARRLAIISGGTGGIGTVTAALLRSQGAKLALLYAPFERSKIEPTIAALFGQNDDQTFNAVKAYECDIASADSVDDAFNAIGNDNVASPSILINAAGYIHLAPLENFKPEEILKHYTINLLGPTLTGQAFTRLYMSHRRRSDLPGGRIVNIASQAAHVALAQHGPYCASKAGLIGLTRCQASEWGPHGITTNSISPGPVWTELGKKAWADRQVREAYQASVPTGSFAEPEEVAKIVAFLCADSSCNINGADIRLDGGYTVR